MKKLLAIFCALTLLLVMLAGCNNTAPQETPTPSSGDNGTDVTEPKATPGPKDIFPEIPLPEIQDEPIDLPHTDELVIYLPPYSDWVLTPVIDHYKKMYPDVNVITQDFNGTEVTAYSDRLSAELAAGKGPDIIFPFNMYSADDYKTANSGAFLDLNEIIEKDKNFNLDDYVKPVLDGGVYNGHRYIMPYSYQVPLYISIPEKLDEIGFDISEMSDVASFLKEVVRTMPRAQANPNFRSMFNWEIFTNSLRLTSGVKLVDFETNTVLPNEEDLKKFLEAYKPYYVIDDDDNNNFDTQLFSHLQSGTFAFASAYEIGSFIRIACPLKTTGDYQITVMPGMDGKINTMTTQTVAIRSGSPNQLNAWNFIKLLIGPEFQSSSYTLLGIPVHRDSIFARVEMLHNYYDNYKENETSGVFAPLSMSEKQAYIDMITDVDYCQVYNPLMATRMFNKYMRPYLRDEISYEDGIAKLRNDLTLYVSE